MPSELGSPPAIEPPGSADAWQAQWEDRVRAALLDQNTNLMGALYAELRSKYQPSLASRIWLEAVSGWDSSAVTG